MGLFSSKTKTYVGTAVQRVLEDDALPGAIKTGMAKSLASENQGQMVGYVFDELAAGIALRANQMYGFGKTKYEYGNPHSSKITSLSAKSAYKDVIDAQMGGEVNLSYYHFGKLNNMHMGWMILQDQFGYNENTNSFNFLDKTVYLEDMQLVVTDATLQELENGSLEQWGRSPTTGPTPAKSIFFPEIIGNTHTPFVLDSNASADYIKVLYCYEEDETYTVPAIDPNAPPIQRIRKVIKRSSLNVTIPEMDQEADYHQAKFEYNGVIGWRLYKHKSGAYPAVDATFDIAFDNLGTYFPFTYFRYNKTKGNANTLNEGYKDSKRLTEYLNMNYDDMCDAIHENPDIADVEQAMMVMAVPAITTNETERHYLFDFFSAMQQSTQSQSNRTTTDIEFEIMKKFKVQVEETGIIIQDKRFKMALNYTNITRRKVKGVIGKVGIHDSGLDDKTHTLEGVTLLGNPIEWTTGESSHWYRRQISDVLYEEIRVFGLEMTYYIFEQYTTTGDEDDKILLIPIDKAITDTYALSMREELLARSLHYVFNSRQVVKIKWYQRGAFKWLLVIAALIITFITQGATFHAFLAALAAGAITAQALIMMIVKFLIKYLITKLVMALFVKIVGVKFAFVVAIIAVAAGFYDAASSGGINNAPWAKELLSLATNLTSAVNTQIAKNIYGIQQDFTDFKKESETKIKLLDEANDLLANTSALAPIIIFGENPDDFYQRTVHSGNIGVVGIEAVGSYVDAMLTLPKLSDSVGELV